MRALVVIGLLTVSLPMHAGTLYKSVTPEGKTVYSDQPPDTGKVEKTFNFSNLPSTPLPDSVNRYRNELEKGMQNRLAAAPDAKQPVLFWAKWCGYCRQAEAYLAEKSISYRKIDIDTAEGARALMQSGGGKGVPVLLTTSQRVQGFSRSAYDALFAGARR